MHSLFNSDDNDDDGDGDGVDSNGEFQDEVTLEIIEDDAIRVLGSSVSVDPPSFLPTALGGRILLVEIREKVVLD